MSECKQRWVPVKIWDGIIILLLLFLVSGLGTAANPDNGKIPNATSNATTTSNLSNSSVHVFKYKVQEDPYFTFSYPIEMNQTISSAEGRNTYHLTSAKEPQMSYLFTSAENPEWAPLNESALAKNEQMIVNTSVQDIKSRQLKVGKPDYKKWANFSSYFTSYLDLPNKELIYTLIMSNNQSVISAVLIEPDGMYNTDYGNFSLKSLLSVTPRDIEDGFTPERKGTDKSLGSTVNSTNKPTGKEIVYDPYVGLYYDTNTGYYYLPAYGVFYNPTTGDYYYPQEFGSYGTDNFIDYTGIYNPYNSGDTSYYDNLYSGYGGTSGYDATDIIMDTYNNRQQSLDASNAMWDDYIKGDQYYGVDDYGYTDPIDTTQEYIDYGLA